MRARTGLRRLLGSLVLLAVLVVAACGGSGTTPSNTGTATLGPTDAYLAEANAALNDLAAAAQSVGDVLQQPDPQSATWREELAVALLPFSDVRRRVDALDAPSAYADAQARLVAVTAGFEEAATLLQSAIQPLNPDDLQRAGELLADAVAQVATVRTMLTTATP